MTEWERRAGALEERRVGESKSGEPGAVPDLADRHSVYDTLTRILESANAHATALDDGA